MPHLCRAQAALAHKVRIILPKTRVTGSETNKILRLASLLPTYRHSNPIIKRSTTASFKSLYRKRSGAHTYPFPTLPAPERSRYSTKTSHY
jgi:hypothetical protein